MVRRVNHDMDNAQRRLLTIQHRLAAIAMEREERHRRQYRARRDKNEEEMVPCLIHRTRTDISCELPN